MKHIPAFDAVLGQDRAIAQLKQLLASKSVPGAMLFTGPASVGKFLTAISFAMAANCCEEGSDSIIGCRVCGSCSRIKSGNHPDVIIIKPDGNYIKIGQIRELIEKISTRPKEALTRFIIIDGASTMTVEASNALLKSLEEPPQNTVFILVSSSMMSVLPTIRSRCCHIGFSPLGRKALEMILISSVGYTSEISASASLMSDGSVRTAVDAIEKGWIEKRRWLYSEVAALRNRSLPVILALAEDLAQKSDDIKASLEIIKSFFRDLVVYRYRPEVFMGHDLKSVLETALPYYQDSELVRMLEKVHESQRSLELNAVSRLVLEMLFLKIAGFHK
ncbi:DNA polymerase III subunit delta' [Desulforegula conservatrix]|uniref:DNA polymerase III subunit delta' n=1 Tax=Desulforegula conservatrix TaxID=153026 RepID=UPI000A058100|nr:DNA polymerase III subunit delta' [Desulforegula conservatrix]